MQPAGYTPNRLVLCDHLRKHFHIGISPRLHQEPAHPFEPRSFLDLTKTRQGWLRSGISGLAAMGQREK
jgi:hypothetical protein